MTEFDPDTLSFTPFDAAPARLIIRPQAVVENWQRMQKLSGKARAAAVVKADAYGLGAEEIVPALYDAGCRDFFVAVPDEGMLAREVAPDARIFVLSGVWPGTEAQFFDYDLVPVLASEDQVAFWTNAVSQSGEHPCALMVDTGMNRLGLSVDEAIALANDPTRPASFSPVLLLSHLACGDEPEHPLTRQQLESFQKVAAVYEGIESSLSNSAGITLGADYHFDLTRPGISLYGGSTGNPDFKPGASVVTAEARIVQLRDIKAGEGVSYGATFRPTRDTRLAVVAAGYADGFHRSLSGSGVPLRQAVQQGAMGFVNGHRVPLAGRITMDLTIFDVTDVPDGDIRVGDYIELIGENILLDDVAKAAGTIGYELLTGLGNRYQRIYV
ncbi:alanine racemase [Rhizobium sp. L1K21]|uniref:alanine racemase n=1 Tax=Rhizobium sp. L1K21 TaxID=2954933 RepID=UPI0020935FCF|nr:alanine racemase [Rhizobium sp. L1K21]MCO6186546.1 alanine racemase [Rhizobium sp. L1K21]